MTIQKTQAIVIKRSPLRESSYLVTLYTKDFGKIRAVSKGIRSAQSGRSSHFELFNWLEILFYEKKRSDTFLLTESSVVDSFPRIRKDIECVGWASYLLELVDAAAELHEPNEELFQILADTLSHLGLYDSELLVRAFETKLLHSMGYLPDFERCSACNGSLTKAFFVFHDGSLVCERCRKGIGRGRPISQGAVKALRFILSHPLHKAWQLKDKGSVLSETSSLLRYLASMKYERRFKTLHFLGEIVTPEKGKKSFKAPNQ
ncbi:MAG: DNA repair protein RecO [Candidatus Omnitrophica bacterium]|nr:DNA repair protein RecO [Candidatus Omnitrophota bacterium]